MDPLGPAQGQAFAVAQKCIRQFRPEQPQPRRGHDGCAEADRVLQRSLSRDLRPDAFGYSAEHDRAGTAGVAAQARRARRQRRGFLQTRRQAGRPDYRTARRAIGSGQVFCAAERRFGGDPRGLQRAAQAFEATGVDQAVPGIGARQCAGMRGRQEHRGRPLHLRQPRVRTLLALFPRQHRRQARRRDFPPRDDGQHRGGGPGRAQFARRPVPQRIRGRARLGEARSRPATA